MSDVVRVIILGAGQRGQAYAHYLTTCSSSNPDNPAILVAFAEPNPLRATQFAKRYGIPQDRVFSHYDEVAALGPHAFNAEAVIVTTQDSFHLDCVVKFAALGYHLLCEKPMSGTLLNCQKMRRALRASPTRIFGMGHVLRYAPHNIVLKEVLRRRVIGDVVQVMHTEPVGHAHFAHSYVRGNWRKQEDSSFSLLTKSCHDLDLIQWFLEASYPSKTIDGAVDGGDQDGGICQPLSISSFGSLSHFRKSRKPKEAGSATRCLDCSLVDSCAYSAKKIYVDGFIRHGELRGFQKSLTDIEDLDSINHALNTTPYGRCVYEMDNDVCDNQSVLMQYQAPHGLITVSFNMIAFSRDQCIRKTTIYGTKGQIEANGHDLIKVYDFASDRHTEYDTGETVVTDGRLPSHESGDKGLVLQFIRAVRAVNQGVMNVHEAQMKYIGCTLDDIYRSHQVVFKAEEARLRNCVVAF